MRLPPDAPLAPSHRPEADGVRQARSVRRDCSCPASLPKGAPPADRRSRLRGGSWDFGAPFLAHFQHTGGESPAAGQSPIRSSWTGRVCFMRRAARASGAGNLGDRGCAGRRERHLPDRWQAGRAGGFREPCNRSGALASQSMPAPAAARPRCWSGGSFARCSPARSPNRSWPSRSRGPLRRRCKFVSGRCCAGSLSIATSRCWRCCATS